MLAASIVLLHTLGLGAPEDAVAAHERRRRLAGAPVAVVDPAPETAWGDAARDPRTPFQLELSVASELGASGDGMWSAGAALSAVHRWGRAGLGAHGRFFVAPEYGVGAWGVERREHLGFVLGPRLELRFDPWDGVALIPFVQAGLGYVGVTSTTNLVPVLPQSAEVLWLTGAVGVLGLIRVGDGVSLELGLSVGPEPPTERAVHWSSFVLFDRDLLVLAGGDLAVYTTLGLRFDATL